MPNGTLYDEAKIVAIVVGVLMMVFLYLSIMYSFSYDVEHKSNCTFYIHQMLNTKNDSDQFIHSKLKQQFFKNECDPIKFEYIKL